MMLHVQVVTADGQPQLHTFMKPEILIGRKPENDLVLGGQDVSGSHACLQVEGDSLMLFDLRSTNGTYVNGQRIPVSTQLGPDDEVSISVFTLRFSLADTQQAAATESSPPGDPPELAPSAAQPRFDTLLDGPPLVRDPSSPPPLAAGLDADGLPPVVARPRQSSLIAPSPIAPFPIAPPPTTPPPIAPPPITLPPIARPPIAPPPIAPAPAMRPRSESPPPDLPAAAPWMTRTEPVVAAGAELTHAWHDPTVRRIFIVGLQCVEVERDGVRLRLPHTFASPEDLSAQLTVLCGCPVRIATSERVLADGTSIQATETGALGPYVVVTRPRSRRVVGLDALVHEQVLPMPAAELLSACTRARLPVLLAALPGVAAASAVAALLGVASGPTALVRGLPTAVLPPHGCTTFDAGAGESMAAVVRLALAGDVQWLGIDEPDAAALEECAWAAAAGCGVVVGLRAGSLLHVLRRAHATGADAGGMTIPYALTALFGPDPENRDTSAGRLSLRWLGELRSGDGPNNVHELFTTARRGNLITTAVPELLAELGKHGFHLAPELFVLT